MLVLHSQEKVSSPSPEYEFAQEFPTASAVRHGERTTSSIIAVGLLMGGSLLLLYVLLLHRRLAGNKKVEAAEDDGKEERQHEEENEITEWDVEKGKCIMNSDDRKTSADQEPELNELVFSRGNSHSFGIEDVMESIAEPLISQDEICFGSVYKVHLKNFHETVVIKHLKGVKINRTEFEQKIQELWKLNHSNLQAIKGYYYSEKEKLLLYDYMTSGSLFYALHGTSDTSQHLPLDWPARARIALDVVGGMAHLHNAVLVHGNIKSSNILLTKDFGACVTEYGLVEFQKSGCIHNFRGSYSGYTAPEVYRKGEFTQKSDIYSLGVLLLELLTGRYPNAPPRDHKQVADLPSWVLISIHEEWTVEVFDPNLTGKARYEEEMVQLLKIAMACVAQSPHERPSVTKVLEMVALIGDSSCDDENASRRKTVCRENMQNKTSMGLEASPHPDQMPEVFEFVI